MSHQIRLMTHMLYVSSAPLPPFFCFFLICYGFLWCIQTLVRDAQLDTGMLNSVITELFFEYLFCLVNIFMWNRYWWFKATLDEFRFCLFSYSLKLTYTKNKQYKHVGRSIFRMECNNECSAFTINIGSSCIHSMKMNSDGNVIKMKSGCFKVI